MNSLHGTVLDVLQSYFLKNDLQHISCTLMFSSLSCALAALYVSGNDSLLGVSYSLSP